MVRRPVLPASVGPKVYRHAIERAVQQKDEDTLQAIAARLVDAAEALAIYRARGYDCASLAAMARLAVVNKP